MEISSYVAKEAIKIAADLIRSRDWSSVETEADVPERLQRHLVMVNKWRNNIHPLGLSNDGEILDESIELSYSIPRSFRATKTSGAVINEDNLINTNQSVVILGDPGSGKTTTLQRIATQLLIRDSISQCDISQYPILVRLREFKSSDRLTQRISDIVGIKYERKAITKTRIIRDDRGNKKKENYEEIELLSGEKSLGSVLIEFIDKTNAMVLVDGLDEAPSESTAAIRQELANLSLHCQTAKFCVTCRSGDYLTVIEGFNNFEITPLSMFQIEEISNILLNGNSGFVRELESKPYNDLAARPLFLGLLLLHYKEAEYLPEKPIEIYEKIIALSLEKWDRTRGVKRKSKYRGFHTQQKIRYLSEVAYLLTYRFEKRAFSNTDLISVYQLISDKYELPKDQCELVVKELESHTGLIVEGYSGYFEFSHLSLQEFLCAYYLVRNPYTSLLPDYLSKYPAPLAIAVALSGDASIWFANLIIGNHSGFGNTSMEATEVLIDRILIEKPFFSKSKELGMALIHILLNIKYAALDNLRSLFDMPNVFESLVESLKHYISKTDWNGEGGIAIKLNVGYQPNTQLKIPREGILAPIFINYLFAEKGIKLREVTHNTGMYWLFEKNANKAN